jgi:uncharacterized protein involved in response to NO
MRPIPIPIRDARKPSPRELLAGVPHRFFFLAGVTEIAVASLWWLWALAARITHVVPPPAAPMPDTAVHALVMIYGFAPFFMFGFMFTAGPKWLHVPPPPPRAWHVPGAIAAVCVFLMVPLQAFGIGGLRMLAAGYALSWLWLAAIFAGLVRRSASPDKVHAKLVLAALVAGALAVGAFALLGMPAYPWLTTAGVWLFLLPVFVVVCHRMIPFFTVSALPLLRAYRPWWQLVVMLGAPVLHGVLTLAGGERFTWPADLLAGVFLLVHATRWGLVQSMSNRLLAMLHVGFAWYGAGFLLAGAGSLWQLTHGRSIGLAGLHAMTIGFASSLLVAMVTRVTCGHSGRMLAADAVTWRLFQVLQLAAVARIAADLLPSPALLLVAIVAWVACLVPWTFRYAPIYWRPRPDGRAG